MQSFLPQGTILLLIFGGAVVMFFSTLKVKNILRLSSSGGQKRSWQVLYCLTIFFLCGYSLAFYLVWVGNNNLLPFLTGIVFLSTAWFIFFSISIYHQTLSQILSIKDEHKIAQEKAEISLHQVQRSQMQSVHKEKMSSLGQLVAGVAHEINNPVNFIYGNLSYASEYIEDLFRLLTVYSRYYPKPPPEVAEVAEEIDLEFLKLDLPRLLGSMQIGAERIREIVSSLRNFSRLDQAECKFASLHEGIDNTLLLLRSRFKIKPGSPSVELAKDYSNLPLIKCFPGEINQVFMNLISNAIDTLEERNNQLPPEELEVNPSKIWIKTIALEEDWVRITIKDNGMGMSEEVSNRIFDPFFTTKPVGKGTGLGLSISHQIIVEKHGGRLRFFSTPSKGTEFVVELPVQKVSNPVTIASPV
ncbi:MAG: ATP-binding protein [Spirulinaceae cyanobacterium]